MATLFDMLAGAQGGRGMDLLAKQFNISQQQAELAVEALLPAFSQGLKRNAANPNDLGAFLSALSSGQHAKYFQDASSAFQPAGIQEGNGILGHLFGSKDVSRAVASQAAQATGLGPDLLKQMLPALASMIMGGLFSQATGQGKGQKTAAGNNPLGQILEQMMGGGAQAPRQRAPQQADNPLGQILEGMFGGGGAAAPKQRQRAPQNPAGDNPLGKILEGMFGGGGAAAPKQQQRAPQSSQSPYGDNPLGKIFEEMMGGGGATQQRAPANEGKQSTKTKATRPAPKTNPSGRARTPYDDLFGEMFETGRKTRDNYEENIGSIFDQFLKGMDRRR